MSKEPREFIRDWSAGVGGYLAFVGVAFGIGAGVASGIDAPAGDGSAVRTAQIMARRSIAGALIGGAFGFTLPISLPLLLVAPLRGGAVARFLCRRRRSAPPYQGGCK